jgi:hypothetical protein
MILASVYSTCTIYFSSTRQQVWGTVLKHKMSGWPICGHSSKQALHRCDPCIDEVPIPSELVIGNWFLLTDSSWVTDIARLQKPSDVPVTT